MKWLSVRIYTSPEGIEPLCGRLYLLGAGGVQIEDSADFNEFVESCTPHWDYIDESLEYMKTCETCVIAYLTDDEAGAQQLSLIRDGVGAMRAADSGGAYGSLRIEVEGRDDEEWANNWKQYYKPFAVGERTLVCPEWEKADNPEGRTVLTMDPGHLFGSGTHSSTKMCLGQIDKRIKGSEKVLDIGCGSGILAILALLLGAREAVCIDIDASAPKVVGENAALNNIPPEKYRVMVGNCLDEDTLPEKIDNDFDIVLANIVADVIIGLAEKAYGYVRPGGLFICSGIIEERERQVADALRCAGFTVSGTVRDGGWSCIVCNK